MCILLLYRVTCTAGLKNEVLLPCPCWAERESLYIPPCARYNNQHLGLAGHRPPHSCAPGSRVAATAWHTFDVTNMPTYYIQQTTQQWHYNRLSALCVFYFVHLPPIERGDDSARMAPGLTCRQTSEATPSLRVTSPTHIHTTPIDPHTPTHCDWYTSIHFPRLQYVTKAV